MKKLLSNYHSESVKEACKKISATDFGLTAGIRDYLPHMYGAAAYTVINEVQQLPLKVSDIYRRLTT